MPSREQELLAQIAAIARSLGLGEEGARVAVAIAMIEGGLSGAVGDRGKSFGPYQFHVEGQLPAYAQARGLAIERAAELARTDPLDAAQWALEGYLGRAIREGQRQGLAGAGLATYVQQYGQRSVRPERAGNQYVALSGSQGGSMVEPTVDEQAPWEEDAEYRGYKEAYTREIQATLQALQEERDALLKSYNEWTMQSYSEAQYAQLDLLQQRVGALDTLIRQTRAALASASSKAIDKWLSSQQQRLSNAIAMGALTQKQVEFEWGKLMDQANMGIDGLIQGYASLRAALPQMGTQSMADAAKQLMLNWRQLGVNIPDFELRVQQYDPLDEIRKRLPPAVDWQQAMAGGGGGGVPAAQGPAAGLTSAPAPTYSPPSGYMGGPPLPESMMPEPWGQAVPLPWQQGLLGSPSAVPAGPATGSSVLPPIRRGGGFPEGAPGAVVGIPQTPPVRRGGAFPQGAPGAAIGVTQAPTATPTHGPALPPGFTPGPSGVSGPTPSTGAGAPNQSEQYRDWLKRHPTASERERSQALMDILSGKVPQ